MSLSRQEVALAGALLLPALIVGWLADSLGWALLVAALVWIVVQHRQRGQLLRWSRRPLSRPENELEPWQEALTIVISATTTTATRSFRGPGALKTFTSPSACHLE